MHDPTQICETGQRKLLYMMLAAEWEYALNFSATYLFSIFSARTLLSDFAQMNIYYKIKSAIYVQSVFHTEAGQFH